MHRKAKIVLCLFFSFFLVACSFNPFSSNNHPTGSGAGILLGAGAGAGTIGLLGGSKAQMALAGLGGAALGYYFTTLSYDAGPITNAGGRVYKIGDYLGIVIPSDQLFESNTADFLPEAKPILESIVTVLKRAPNNNIIVSGNMSGFGRERDEQKLSEKRAQKIVAYLWNAGINNFKDRSIDTRKLNYVGYGNYFPIANSITNNGIRQNSRIQITSYPSDCNLKLSNKQMTMNNIGELNHSAGSGDHCL